MKSYQIKLNFIRDVIGSQPSNENLRTEYIVAKMTTGRTGMSAEVAMAKVKDEVENLKKDPEYQKTIDELGDKSLTVFHRNADGVPCLSDVQLRGFFKESFAFVARENQWLKKKNGEIFAQDAAYRDWIGDRIRFVEQYVPYIRNGGAITKADSIYQRPIRVTTMQGDRVSIASSELIRCPTGVTFTLVSATNDFDLDKIKAVLDRGLFRGISQWANAQYGTFTYEIL